MKVYKIKRLSDGKFSLGGSWPKFGKFGKTWAGIQALKRHFALVEEKVYDYKKKDYVNRNVEEVYGGCVILEFEVSDNPKEIALKELINV